MNGCRFGIDFFVVCALLLSGRGLGDVCTGSLLHGCGVWVVSGHISRRRYGPIDIQ